MKKKSGKYLFLLIVLTLMIAAGCGGRKEEEAEAIIRPVKTITIDKAEAGLKRTFSGTIRPGKDAAMAFRVSGKVEEILVDIGERVERDQLLARIDSHDYQLSVKTIAGNLESARAAARNSESGYQRNKRLYENSNISKAELDQYETQRNSDRAQVESLEAQLAQARNQLVYCGLKAPFSGYISGKKVEEFENVVSGQTVLTLVDPGELKADVGVPESLISRVNAGQDVSVTLESLPARRFSGTVIEVGVTLDRSTGTYPVTVMIDEPSPEILPGMSAEVTFTFGFAGEKSFVVPTAAIVEDIRTGERSLWIVSENTVEKRKVQTGALVSEGIEIVSGLNEGEVVVTAGVHQLEEGMEVRILE